MQNMYWLINFIFDEWERNLGKLYFLLKHVINV